MDLKNAFRLLSRYPGDFDLRIRNKDWWSICYWQMYANGLFNKLFNFGKKIITNWMEDKNGDMFWGHQPLLGWFYLYGNYTGAMPISVRWILTIVSRVRCPGCWRKDRRPSDMCYLCYGHKSSTLYFTKNRTILRRPYGDRPAAGRIVQFLVNF